MRGESSIACHYWPPHVVSSDILSGLHNILPVGSGIPRHRICHCGSPASFYFLCIAAVRARLSRISRLTANLLGGWDARE